ncbi:unnamed protein product [Chrysodeixis includens]|uniref:Uncharacterized protein n=1 Tax=Chrysodeixis includens TaxID=689277 RepID=A0A9P0FVT4_CHRIL|nr:unnamed protein product [Chrysodeixis includens]
MKILVIISSILIAQTSASFFDVFQGAVLTVQNSFGKMISDVVSDVKETVDCTILAVEHALALSEDAALRYYEKCGTTINNTVTVTETRHIESSPQAGGQYSSDDDYLKKEIPKVIDAKINETLTKMLGNYNPSEKLKDVENVLVKETEQLANVSDLVRQELKKVSESEVTSDMKNETHLYPEPSPSVDSIMQEIKLLENKEQNAINNTQATEIHRVIDEVLARLDNLQATEATENVKLEHIIKDIEQNSNSSFVDLRQQLESWKAEESRHIDDIQTKILEHERNSHPETHNNTFNLLPPSPYDSDIRQMNVKEVNITSTKRMSNVSRDISSIETSVNAKNEQSHTLTLTKPKANNGPGNLSGLSSTSTSLKISQTTPNVSNDGDLKITVISSKSYSLSKSVSIRGKAPPAEITTSNNQGSVHLTTDQPSTTLHLGSADENLSTFFFGFSTKGTHTGDSTIFSSDVPSTDENTKIPATEVPTTGIPIETTTQHELHSTTELTTATAIETTTSSSSDYSSTTASSDLVTEQSPSTQAITTIGHEEITSTSTTETVTTAVPDTTTQGVTESQHVPDYSSITTKSEESTATEAVQTTTSSVNQHNIDETEKTTTTNTPLETSTVTKSSTDYSTTNSHTDQESTTANVLDTTTTVPITTSAVHTEISTEQSTKSYEEKPATSDIPSTTTPDLTTVPSTEANTEKSTTLQVEESTPSVTILNTEYTSTVITTTPEATTAVVPESTTECSSSTASNDDVTTTSKSITTINPVPTDVTSEMITELTSTVKPEETTVLIITTHEPELTTENSSKNPEQSTTSHGDEIISTVKTVDIETTTTPVLSTNSPDTSTAIITTSNDETTVGIESSTSPPSSTKNPDISTTQTTVTEEETKTTENQISTVTTLNPDVTTGVTETTTQQSETNDAEPTTNVNIKTTNENNVVTESSTSNSTSANDISAVTTLKPDATTEAVTETIAQESTTHEVEPTTIVNIETTTVSDVVTESPTERHNEQNTTPFEEVTTSVNEISTEATTKCDAITDAVTETSTQQITTSNEELTTKADIVTTLESEGVTEAPSSSTTHYEEITTNVNDISTETTPKPESITEVVTESVTEQSTTNEEPTTTVNIETTGSDVVTETFASSTTRCEEVTTSVNEISTVTTPKPDSTTEVVTESVTQQSTTTEAEQTSANIETTTGNDVVTESHTSSIAPYEEVKTSVDDMSIATTAKFDAITEPITESVTQQSTTNEAEQTSANIETTTEINVVTEMHIEQSTTLRQEEPTSVSTENIVTTTKCDTESPSASTEPNTTSYVEEITTSAPTTAAEPDLTTEYNSQTHSESTTQQNNEEVTSDAITEADTVTEHHHGHVQISTTTEGEVLEDLTTVKPTTTENNVNEEITEAPTVTTSDSITESTTESQTIHTDVSDSESQFVTPENSEPSMTSLPDIVTTHIPSTTTESRYENNVPTSIRPRRSRRRNSTRSGRRRNATSTTTETPTTVPTTLPTEPIALQLLPVFRHAVTADPTIENHVQSNTNIPVENTYVPHYEHRLPARRRKRPVVSEVQSSSHSLVQSSTHTETHENFKNLSELNEAPKAIEHRRINRDTQYPNSENAQEATTPRHRRSSKHNRTRRNDQTTEPPRPDFITPANRRRTNRRRPNRSNELNEDAFRSRATTSKPVQRQNSYDISPADYDALFNIPPRNSEAHKQAVRRTHEIIANSKRNDRIINSILQNKKRNGARNLFDILG